MAQRPLTIFCNISLGQAALALLAQETAGHHLLTAQNDFSQADVAFGQPEPEQVIASPRLQWIHLSSAGHARYDTEAVSDALRERGAVLTNSSHVYDAPCAQHVLSLMLADARQLFSSYENQRTEHAWPTDAIRRACYLLNGQTVLLLGLGAIAQYLIRLLQPFDMAIIAVRRNAQPQAGIEVVSEAALADVLPRADHVVDLLPQNPSTLGFMDAARFGQMKRGANFYNIGRGQTVEQEALLNALRAGHLGAAYLDVTDPEPLPPDHPLWTAPRCFIMPHTAGGHRDEERRLVQHFARNLRAFEAGEPLADCVFG
jgi:phosphoglycerate dehydrogenase-like enzyme